MASTGVTSDNQVEGSYHTYLTLTWQTWNCWQITANLSQGNVAITDAGGGSH